MFWALSLTQSGRASFCCIFDFHVLARCCFANSLMRIGIPWEKEDWKIVNVYATLLCQGLISKYGEKIEISSSISLTLEVEQFSHSISTLEHSPCIQGVSLDRIIPRRTSAAFAKLFVALPLSAYHFSVNPDLRMRLINWSRVKPNSTTARELPRGGDLLVLQTSAD